MRALSLVAIAAIPLQWFVLATSGLGTLQVHEAALFLFSAAILYVYGAHGLAPITAKYRVFLLANLFMYFTWITVAVANGRPVVDPVQQLIYLVVMVAIATFFYRAASSSRLVIASALRWAAPLTLLSLLFAFYYSMSRNGVDGISVLRAGIESADPSVLEFGLYRKTFVGFGYDAETVRSNFRHEIFAGLLVSMLISSWAVTLVPFTTALPRLIYRLSMVGATLAIILSLSRSITLAALVWPLLIGVRAVVTGRVRAREQLMGISVVVGIFALSLTGVLALLQQRVTAQTDSYTGRQTKLEIVLTRIEGALFSGPGVNAEGDSPHNFVLDAWQEAGILVAIPAVVVAFFLLFLWLDLLRQIGSLSAELVAVAAALTLPLVRLVTQGGGLMTIVEWTALAFVMGVLAGNSVRQVGTSTSVRRDRGVGEARRYPWDRA